MYAALGVRYLTLTHFKNNDWADSSTDKPAHNGLTPFGKDVVRELNRLGMMVDISHVADKTFYDAHRGDEGAGHRVALVVPRDLEPPAQHDRRHAAGARQERRRGDDQLRGQLPQRGTARRPGEKVGRRRRRNWTPLSKACGGDEACATLAISKRRARGDGARASLPAVSWEKIVEHIDHAVKVAGVDHVGLGSDFDGATMPIGMEDVSKLPKMTDALLKKGYSRADVKKILGGNLLRVMAEVERVAGANEVTDDADDPARWRGRNARGR